MGRGLWGQGSAPVRFRSVVPPASAPKHMVTLEALKLATTVDDLPQVEQALLDLANKGHEARATLRSNYFDTLAGRLTREGVVLCVHEPESAPAQCSREISPYGVFR